MFIRKGGAYMLSIISVIVSGIVTIANLLFTFWHENRCTRRKRMIESIEKLYFPFYRNCLEMQYPENQFSMLGVKEQDYFLNAVINNIHYASTKTQALFNIFYSIRVHSKSSQEDYTTDKKVDDAFKDFYDSMLSDNIRLCRRTRLPKPPQHFCQTNTFPHETPSK